MGRHKIGSKGKESNERGPNEAHEDSSRRKQVNHRPNPYIFQRWCTIVRDKEYHQMIGEELPEQYHPKAVIHIPQQKSQQDGHANKQYANRIFQLRCELEGTKDKQPQYSATKTTQVLRLNSFLDCNANNLSEKVASRHSFFFKNPFCSSIPWQYILWQFTCFFT